MRRLIFGEREERVGGCFETRERNEGEVCLGSCVAVLRQSIWRLHTCTLGLVGFNLLSQLTELTTSCIYLTSNGIPVCDACSCLLLSDNFGQ